MSPTNKIRTSLTNLPAVVGEGALALPQFGPEFSQAEDKPRPAECYDSNILDLEIIAEEVHFAVQC